jgi:heptaprenyl diphosphate synthase
MPEALQYGVFPNLGADLSRVERALLLEVEDRPDLTEIVQHLFDGIPKLVRPTLALMAAYACSDPICPVSKRVIDAATAIELTHVGTMCHDDVMDEADTRRGRASVRARWGNVMAILNGDFLLASASEIAAELGAKEARILGTTFRRLCTGQMIETRDLYNPSRTVESYFAAIAGKTATLLGSACRIGVLEAGGDEEAAERAASFGEHFGIAFQINDDLLDLTASSETLGKAAGKDVLEGVYTLPVLLAREECPELRTLLDPPMASERIPLIRELVCNSGALMRSAGIAEGHMREAEATLDDHTIPADSAEALLDFARGIVRELDRYGRNVDVRAWPEREPRRSRQQ